MSPKQASGTLALIGGGEWHEGCRDFDTELLARADGEVVVLPTAAAFEHPDRAVARATE
jgi:cyanophycinase